MLSPGFTVLAVSEYLTQTTAIKEDRKHMASIRFACVHVCESIFFISHWIRWDQLTVESVTPE